MKLLILNDCQYIQLLLADINYNATIPEDTYTNEKYE